MRKLFERISDINAEIIRMKTNDIKLITARIVPRECAGIRGSSFSFTERCLLKTDDKFHNPSSYGWCLALLYPLYFILRNVLQLSVFVSFPALNEMRESQKLLSLLYDAFQRIFMCFTCTSVSPAKI